MSEVSYDDFVSGLQAKWGSFIMEAQAGKTNKTAALRSRKLSMSLRRDLKDFRVISVENDQAPEEDDEQ